LSKQKVVIVGGGFGGVKTALELAEESRFRVTLISNETHFCYSPTLYHMATGGRSYQSSIPLSNILSSTDTNILHDEVIAVDKVKRTVKTKAGHTLGYDALILSLGMKTNYFGIKGLEQYSYGVKTPAEAEELKQHLHKQLLDDKKPDLNYVVIGGGPTGVELAGSLPSYIQKICKQHGLGKRAIHVDLIEAEPRILPRMPKSFSQRVAKQLRKNGINIFTRTAVQAQTSDALMVGKKPIRSHTVVWTAGTTNHPFYQQQHFQLSYCSKVRVDHYLQAEPGIYVIGDNADTPYSGMAQTAIHDAQLVANNLKRLIEGQPPVPYAAKKPIYVIPAGTGWAAVLWGPLKIYGKLGWMLRKAGDLVAYHDYLSALPAIKHWAAENDEEDSCLICANTLTKALYRSGEV
jgi:NADH:ubiquinone reductase (H+-translocating)